MKKNYTILRKIISPEKAEFLKNYYLNKRKVSRLYFDTAFISQFNKEYGIWNDPQCMGAWSNYGDIAGDTLLEELQPIVEKFFKKKLYPTYSYVRVYEKGHLLARHKDRESCELSTTLNLGGTEWPIYIDENPKSGFWITKDSKVEGNISIKKENDYYSEFNKGKKVILKPGDMLVYQGDKNEHWREPLSHGMCVQIFLHYVDQTGKFQKNIYDNRPMLGVDSSLQRKED